MTQQAEHAEPDPVAQVDVDAASSGAARPRRASAYDLPTPEKRAWGSRLREAREVAGMTLTDAAQRLGYSQPVQLSLMENGNRMPPLNIVVEAAKLYGTTCDFLAGLAADPTADPLLGAQRIVAAQVTTAVRGLIVGLVETGAEAARMLRPDVGRITRMAAAVLEADRALGVVRSRATDFDETIAGGASLVARLELAAELAREHIEQAERSRRLQGAAARVVYGVGLATEDPIDVSALLCVEAYLRPPASAYRALSDDSDPCVATGMPTILPAAGDEGAQHA